MDPISQGAIGAAFAESISRREQIVTAAWFGCLAGMAPDLDVLIQSPTDPLLFLEYHRHFTHALIFIPVGALIVTLVLYKLIRHTLTFKQAYLASLIGYATHGLLDACTSYGTQLFWPFSDMRVAWNNVSVVDPAFTVPLVVLVIIAAVRRQPRFAYAGVGWALFYLTLGVVQVHRAEDTARQLAESRGHNPQQLTVKASFANLVLWKSIYEHDGIYYVDAIRAFTDLQACEGESIEKLALAKHLPYLDRDSQQALDIERFRWFSSDYLATYADGSEVIDIRYSMVPNEIDPLWGITLARDATGDQHVAWWSRRDTSAAQRDKLISLFQGEGCGRIL